MKIFSFGILHETLYLRGLNEFSTLENFYESYWARHKPGGHGVPPNYWAIALQRWYQLAQELGDDYSEGLATGAVPSAPLTTADYKEIKSIIVEDLRAYILKNGYPDALLLNLHGAMVAEDCLDCEGDILEIVRQVVGKNVVISVILDPHAHITDRMINFSNMIMCYREYPHTDVAEVAEQLYLLTKKSVESSFIPKVKTLDSYMITQLMTQQYPMKAIVNKMKSFEGHNGIEAVTIGHSFPWGDVDEIGVKTVIIFDASNSGTEGYVDKLLQAMSCILYQTRDLTRPVHLVLNEAFQQLASQEIASPIIFADYADNAGGGAHSCATFLVHELVYSNFEGAIAFSAFWDPCAVELLLTYEVGDRLRVKLAGGKNSEDVFYDGNPLDVEVEIVGMSKEPFAQNFSHSLWNTGRLVGVKLLAYFEEDGNVISFPSASSGDHFSAENNKMQDIYLVLNDVRVQTFSPECFVVAGIHPEQMKVLVVKSMYHYRAEFSRLTDQFYSISSPGVLNPNIADIQYANLIEDEVWPLSKSVAVMDKLCEEIAESNNPYYNELVQAVENEEAQGSFRLGYSFRT